MLNLTYRRATINDLPTIITAYAEGSVGDLYEEIPQSIATMHAAYKEAFDKIVPQISAHFTDFFGFA